MLVYIIRRVLYAIPILIGVNLITFALFFLVNSPDDIARTHLGNKHVNQIEIDNWKNMHGYNKPLFYNPTERNFVAQLTETLFFQQSLKLFSFDFGMSDGGRDISEDILQRMWPSLFIAVPILILGLGLEIFFAVILTFLRGTVWDLTGITLCVILMSISGLFYIIGGQYLIAKVWRLVPISGYNEGFSAFKFIVLPVIVAVIAGLGGSVRWYRSLLLEEIGKDYIKTARAKGLSEIQTLFKHALPNALIPILTGLVVIIPTLFMGSLILESFFGVPGLGSYTIDAIAQQDFSVVRVMVFLGSVLYILGLILTDLSYLLVDPRVRL